MGPVYPLADRSYRILFNVGAEVSACIDDSQDRKSILIWFSDLTKREGPLFRIVPSGLHRHIAMLEFGDYSRPCIELIRKSAKQEAYQLLANVLSKLSEEHDTNVATIKDLENRNIGAEFQVRITVLGIDNPYSPEQISKSISEILVPLILAMTELIGYEAIEDPKEAGNLEGEEHEVLSKRRERSKKNRHLCLLFHGAPFPVLR